MAQILGKTPDGLYKKIQARDVAWTEKGARLAANALNRPVYSMGQPISQEEFVKGDIPREKMGKTHLPSKWNYNPMQNKKYVMRKTLNDSDFKSFIRELYGDDLYFQMYPNEKQ